MTFLHTILGLITLSQWTIVYVYINVVNVCFHNDLIRA
jgi:hypothetical protein